MACYVGLLIHVVLRLVRTVHTRAAICCRCLRLSTCVCMCVSCVNDIGCFPRARIDQHHGAVSIVHIIIYIGMHIGCAQIAWHALYTGVCGHHNRSRLLAD